MAISLSEALLGTVDSCGVPLLDKWLWFVRYTVALYVDICSVSGENYSQAGSPQQLRKASYCEIQREDV